MEKVNVQQELDQEWVDLILVAYNLGLTVEEVRAFINKSRKN